MDSGKLLFEHSGDSSSASVMTCVERSVLVKEKVGGLKRDLYISKVKLDILLTIW